MTGCQLSGCSTLLGRRPRMLIIMANFRNSHVMHISSCKMVSVHCTWRPLIAPWAWNAPPSVPGKVPWGSTPSENPSQTVLAVGNYCTHFGSSTSNDLHVQGRRTNQHTHAHILHLLWKTSGQATAKTITDQYRLID